MTYLLVKAVLSGIIIVAVSEVARRSPGARWSDRVASARFHLGHYLALARYGRYGAHRRSAGSDLLVRAAVIADVSGTSGDA
jgi:hypothetical protein